MKTYRQKLMEMKTFTLDVDVRAETRAEAKKKVSSTPFLRVSPQLKQTRKRKKELVCAECGSGDISVRAWVNINSRKFDHFEDESFAVFPIMCKRCGHHVSLSPRGVNHD